MLKRWFPKPWLLQFTWLITIDRLIEYEVRSIYLFHPGIDLLIWGVNQVVPFLILLDESFHTAKTIDITLYIMNTVERISWLMLSRKINKIWAVLTLPHPATQQNQLQGTQFNLRLNRLRQGPSLHLGLEPHVVDLEREAVPVHPELFSLSASVWPTGLQARPLDFPPTTRHQPRPSRDCTEVVINHYSSSWTEYGDM